jgi:hypothetical protein
MVPPSKPSQHHRRPHNQEELFFFMQEVANTMADFDVKLPYHGDLVQLQADAFNFYWIEDCKA